MSYFFSGFYEHRLDDKKRLRIPAQFRKTLLGESGDQPYSFMRGLNRCIYIFPKAVLDKKLQAVSSSSISEEPQNASLVYGSIFAAEEDGQGRVTIPLPLRLIAEIDKDVISIGKGDYIELWAAERYKKILTDADYDSVFRELGL